MFRFKIIGGGVVVIILLTTLVFQRNQISTERHERDSLRQAQGEALQPGQESPEMSKLLLDSKEFEDLRKANRELPALRNEMRQLRTQAPELERLRRENQRLASSLRSLTSSPPRQFSEMEGYVAKETWAHQGFASPEAALQTFLWAVREGQFQTVAECMSPESRIHFEQEFGGKSEQERTKALQQGLGQMIRTGGYRLVTKEQLTEDRVALGIQAVAGGTIAKVVLTRFGNEWKFHDAGGQ